jgi:hypothetical protein
MNVFGNSLKFTTVCFLLGTPFISADKIGQDGYVHVIIRQLPSTPDLPPNRVKLELVVVDTGKVRTDCHLNGANLIKKDNRGSARIFSRREPIDYRGNRAVLTIGLESTFPSFFSREPNANRHRARIGNRK